jgi:hypothetical protein
MAKKKGAAPSKLCPKCGKSIHARSKSHDACGWKDDGKKTVPATTKIAAAQDGKVTAAQAWREAVRVLGKDRKASDMASWIRSNYPSVTINDKTIYTSRNAAIKSLAAKQAAGGQAAAKARRGRKPKAEAFPFGANAPAGDTQKQFQQILELTKEIPPDKIRKLLDLAEQLQKI